MIRHYALIKGERVDGKWVMEMDHNLEHVLFDEETGEWVKGWDLTGDDAFNDAEFITKITSLLIEMGK